MEESFHLKNNALPWEEEVDLRADDVACHVYGREGIGVLEVDFGEGGFVEDGHEYIANR